MFSKNSELSEFPLGHTEALKQLKSLLLGQRNVHVLKTLLFNTKSVISCKNSKEIK